MIIIRPAKRSDLLAIYQLAQKVSVGIINLPVSTILLEKMLELSCESFASDINEPYKELYFFVMENLTTKHIEGCCAIYSKDGVTNPISCYATHPLDLHAHFHAIDHWPVLFPKIYQEGPTEICALYLNTALRKAGLGKFLSYSRFLFMAAFPQLFTKTVFAILRGDYNENKESIFWEKIGRQVLDIPYKEMRRLINEELIDASDIVSKQPFLKKDIPIEILQGIGKTHPNTVPALELLFRQGFMLSHEIASDDGGPMLICSLSDIKIIKEAKTGIVGNLKVPDFDAGIYLIANKQKDNFRIILDRLMFNENDEIILAETAATTLQVCQGSVLCYAPL